MSHRVKEAITWAALSYLVVSVYMINEWAHTVDEWMQDTDEYIEYLEERADAAACVDAAHGERIKNIEDHLFGDHDGGAP